MPSQAELRGGLQTRNPLARIIEERIGQNGPMPFDKYVDIWHSGATSPDGRRFPGFYELHDLAIGDNQGALDKKEVDFITYPEATPLFGFMLARRILDLSGRMGSPSDFKVVEMGGGNGTLAYDTIHGLQYYDPSFPVDYTIVESSRTLADKQRRRLEGLPARVVEGSALDSLPQNVTGVFLSNELVDDLPTKIALYPPDSPVLEFHIGNEGGDSFSKVWQTPSAECLEYVRQYRGFMEVDNAVAPINVNAKTWLGNVASALDEGFVITIDFPFTSWESAFGTDIFSTFAAPSRNVARDSNGRMDYLFKENVGKGNITSKVDFGALEMIGGERGLMVTDSCMITEALSRFNFASIIDAVAKMSSSERQAVLGDRELNARYIANRNMHESFAMLIQRKSKS